jgi:hypothetical protein
MRTVLATGVIAMLLAFGPSASAGVFPDLPGLTTAENATEADAASSGTTSSSSDVSVQDDRVSAPDSDQIVSTVVNDVEKDKVSIVARLPGGASLPIIREAAPVSSGTHALAVQALLALFVVVLYTRFLVRLNSL